MPLSPDPATRSRTPVVATRQRDIADELRDLLDQKDGRTIEELRAAEPSWSFVVEKVESRSATHTSVEIDGDGLWGGFNRPDIKAGDTITVWDGHDRPLMGFGRHGWALNDEIIEWKTPWERVAERVSGLAEGDRRQRERFAAQRDELDRRVASLPAPLRRRIERFRRESASFRVDSEAYEMAAAGDAPKIARALAAEQGWELDDDLRADVDEETVKDIIQAFSSAGYEEQKRRVPDLDEGHSGNTFGGAVRLAYALLAGAKV